MKHSNKKGFTIVELVIVIAVIAILAAVLIPTFSSLIKKANLSNDKQMVAMMNKSLQIEFVTEKPTNASDALNALYANGFSAGKLEPFSNDYHYAYSLDTNMFYLLDETDTVIYPEKSSIANDKLWGLYKNQDSDKVVGIKNYVALEPVTNQQKFNAVFDAGEYQLDLNNFYISVRNDSNAKIKLRNGTLAKGDAIGFDKDESVLERKQYTPVVSDAKDSTWVIEDKIINETRLQLSDTVKKLVISNCTIIGKLQLDLQGYKDFEVEIKDNLFTGASSWSLAIYEGASHGKFTISGNKFVNAGRGMNIGFNTNAASTGTQHSQFIIENNTFDLNHADNSKNNAIQLHGFRQNFLPTDGSQLIIIRNNKINSATAAVVIHSKMALNDTRGHDDDRAFVDAEGFANLVTFSGNVLGENVNSVIADPEFDPGTNENLIHAIVTALTAKFN